MTTPQKTALDNLMETTMIYQGKAHYFTKYKQLSTGNIVVYSDNRTFNFLPNELADFLNELEPFQEKSKSFLPSRSEKPKTEVIVQLPQENKPLKDTLLDVLKEIKANPTPENLKKAESICNVSNTLINIQKTEIQMLRLQKKLQK